mmetsp:Transcript_12138/g.21485  ORF Transcript_12138/g.21485 Transcript_12138/m.21485 type:complete len:116 (-) Transcript_12138:35-382(-)
MPPVLQLHHFHLPRLPDWTLPHCLLDAKQATGGLTHGQAESVEQVQLDPTQAGSTQAAQVQEVAAGVWEFGHGGWRVVTGEGLQQVHAGWVVSLGAEGADAWHAPPLLGWVFPQC